MGAAWWCVGILVAGGLLPGASSMPPLRIAPSLDFEGDASLVASPLVAGSGTVDDPYVLEDLLVLHTRGFGIRLKDTTAYVVVRDMDIPGYAGGVTSLRECPTCDVTEGVVIENASHVLLDRVRVWTATHGIRITNSVDVRVEHARLGDGDVPVPRVAHGLRIEGSRDVRVDSTIVANTTRPASVGASHGVRFVDAEFVATDGIVPVFNATDVAWERSRIHDTEIFLLHEVEGLAIRHSAFHGGRAGVVTSTVTGARVTGVEVCGTSFETPIGVAAIFLRDTAGVRIIGNMFEAPRVAADLIADDVRMEGNVIAGATVDSVRLGGRGLAFHHNSVGSARGASIFAAEADARGNWWGDASGPAGIGPGEGEPLRTGTANVPYEPWLTAPPEIPRTCDPVT